MESAWADRVVMRMITLGISFARCCQPASGSAARFSGLMMVRHMIANDDLVFVRHDFA